MKFVIRDDDVNYFSTPADIERWYADIFAEGIPVGFSAIPYVKPVSDVYPKDIPPSDEEYPISRNAALVTYMKEHPLIEVLQHGTTHETVDGVYEYARAVPRTEAKRGREELERALGKPVTIFVPPHDWINSSGIRAVEYARMDVIRGRGAGLRNWIWRPRYAGIFIYMLVWKAAHARRGRVPAYPYVLDFGKHREACSYRLEDTDVFEGLAYAHQKDGLFVVVTHLHYYTEEKKARLRAIIARARELGAEFVPPSALF
ncbi:MAG TPA: DUF2334 domain-containing protein [Candidatus Paceibacterota bacterium]|nr:DUF2334 domain-containing protein [Candidatus Paceibacterota bacterium]